MSCHWLIQLLPWQGPWSHSVNVFYSTCCSSYSSSAYIAFSLSIIPLIIFISGYNHKWVYPIQHVGTMLQITSNWSSSPWRRAFTRCGVCDWWRYLLPLLFGNKESSGTLEIILNMERRRYVIPDLANSSGRDNMWYFETVSKYLSWLVKSGLPQHRENKEFWYSFFQTGKIREFT